MRLIALLVTALSWIAAPAFAAPFSDIWATWMPDAATPSKEQIHDFHQLMMIIITSISVFVIALLIYTVIRFRRSANPVPSKTTHNVTIEIIWTAIPCLILLVIAVPSFRLMYFLDRTEKPDMTLKVTGYQWYWGYSYPDQEIEEYSLYMVPTEQDDPKGEFTALRAMPTYQRLLSTYELSSGKVGFIVLPVEKNIRILVTASDVIHSWAIPQFGVKKDAVPGRLNETWARIDRPGIYYGQCSEICGVKHGFMPIEIRAVPQETFDAWVKLMKEDTAAAFEMVQQATAQYAHPQVIAPRLKPNDLVEIVKEKI
jgi:cytochrome c oxidase subunit 2